MKKIFFLINFLIILIISILLILTIEKVSVLYVLLSLLLLSIIFNLLNTLNPKKKNFKKNVYDDELNLKHRVSDFLNVLDKGNINETLLKETYKKTILLFESLIIDKETNTLIMNHFKYMLQNELKRSTRYKSKFSLLLIKIHNSDHFNNNKYRILKEIKTLSKYFLRDMDIIGRYNSDTLIFLLPETGIKGANTVGERILNLVPTINKHQIVDEEVKLSIGISTFPYNGKQYEIIIENGEKNVNQAEMLGSNQVIFNVDEV